MSIETAPIQVYWRPGCHACSSMRLALGEAGVRVEWHDIWADQETAAFVRSVADGNETMPTVTVGGRTLVAPRPARLIEELRVTRPGVVGSEARRWPPLRLLQWVGIITLLVVGQRLSAAGRVGVSWLVDGGAVVFFLAMRKLRTRAAESRMTG
jgi:mycoredoxin